MIRRAPRDKSATVPVLALFVFSCSVAMVVLSTNIGVAQNSQYNRGNNCANIQGSGNYVNCPPPVIRHDGTCPPNYIYSRTHGDCIPIQNRGGVIPCSPDDMSFIPGRGWVSNCR